MQKKQNRFRLNWYWGTLGFPGLLGFIDPIYYIFFVFLLFFVEPLFRYKKSLALATALFIPLYKQFYFGL